MMIFFRKWKYSMQVEVKRKQYWYQSLSARGSTHLNQLRHFGRSQQMNYIFILSKTSLFQFFYDVDVIMTSYATGSIPHLRLHYREVPFIVTEGFAVFEFQASTDAFIIKKTSCEAPNSVLTMGTLDGGMEQWASDHRMDRILGI